MSKTVANRFVFYASFIVTSLGDRSSLHEESIWFRSMEVVMVTLFTWWLFRIPEQDVTGRHLMNLRFLKYFTPIVHLLQMPITVSRFFSVFFTKFPKELKYLLGQQNLTLDLCYSPLSLFFKGHTIHTLPCFIKTNEFLAYFLL